MKIFILLAVLAIFLTIFKEIHKWYKTIELVITQFHLILLFLFVSEESQRILSVFTQLSKILLHKYVPNFAYIVI